MSKNRAATMTQKDKNANASEKNGQKGTTMTQKDKNANAVSKNKKNVPDALAGSVTIPGKDKHRWIVAREANPGNAALSDATIKRISDALDKNDYASALLTFANIDGAASWYIAHQETTTVTGKPYNRRTTQAFGSAIMRLTYLGKIAPMQFVVATVPTRTVNGQKIVSGTRLFKRA